MEIILKEDVKGLGYKDDIVDVRPGYAQNYLIPQGFAIAASSSNRKVRDENIRQASHKATKMKQDAEQLAENIGDMKLTLSTKAGESGKIFGAITPLQIADLLTEKGYNIERKKISLPNSVKELGEYDVELDLHKEVKHTIKVEVIAE